MKSRESQVNLQGRFE